MIGTVFTHAEQAKYDVLKRLEVHILVVVKVAVQEYTKL